MDDHLFALCVERARLWRLSEVNSECCASARVLACSSAHAPCCAVSVALLCRVCRVLCVRMRPYIARRPRPRRAGGSRRLPDVAACGCVAARDGRVDGTRRNSAENRVDALSGRMRGRGRASMGTSKAEGKSGNRVEPGRTRARLLRALYNYTSRPYISIILQLPLQLQH
jgi:hypothetical protein